MRWVLFVLALSLILFSIFNNNTETTNSVVHKEISTKPKLLPVSNPIQVVVKKENIIPKNTDKIKPQQNSNPTNSVTSKLISMNQNHTNIKSMKVRPDHVVVEIKMGNWAVSFGDILIGKINSQAKVKTGQAKVQDVRLWPTAEIPFVIDKDLTNIEHIYDVMDYFHENTPIRFVSAKGQQDGIVFKSGEEHCYSYLGKLGGFQPIFLSKGCGFLEITHEVLHVLGFVHEQSRTDRDNFLEIIWKNIDPKFHLQFLKVPDSFMLASQEGPFDYKSVMIYNQRAFAKPGQVSMKSKTSEIITPSKMKMSKKDIERLFLVYGQ